MPLTDGPLALERRELRSRTLRISAVGLSLLVLLIVAVLSPGIQGTVSDIPSPEAEEAAQRSVAEEADQRSVAEFEPASTEPEPAIRPEDEPTDPGPPGAPRCTAPTPYTDAVMARPGPVAYWRLGETTGKSACDSAGSSNGIYRNDYLAGRPSLIADDLDSSVQLDGVASYVNVPSTPALSPAGPFSVEAWVSPATLSVSQTVVRKEGQFLLRLLFHSVFYRVWWSDGTYTELRSPAVMELGAPQHLVATYDGRAMRLYRNGSQIAWKAATKVPATRTSNVFLGQSGGYDYFAGGLDDVAQYGRALSPAAISAHYQAGRAASLTANH
jgi:hypothetical protein